jgi:hypothetical protein
MYIENCKFNFFFSLDELFLLDLIKKKKKLKRKGYNKNLIKKYLKYEEILLKKVSYLIFKQILKIKISDEFLLIFFFPLKFFIYKRKKYL